MANSTPISSHPRQFTCVQPRQLSLTVRSFIHRVCYHRQLFDNGLSGSIPTEIGGLAVMTYLTSREDLTMSLVFALVTSLW